MAVLPQIRRLMVDDFKNQKEWIRPLFYVLNQFMEATINALNHGLTLNANCAASIVTVNLTTVPTASSPVSVPWNLQTQPTAIHIGNIAGATITAAVEIQWTYNAGLKITNLVGVTPTNTAPITLTLTCFTG